MGMATFTKNEDILNEEFSELETLIQPSQKTTPRFHNTINGNEWRLQIRDQKRKYHDSSW